MMLKVREDIMEQSMVYEGYVKGEGVYQGEGRLLFKNGNSCDLCSVIPNIRVITIYFILALL